MATNQGDRQASVRAVTGTSYTYEGDWHALFDQTGIAAGDFNGRLLAWINQRLGSTFSNLPSAQAGFAINQGAKSWGELGTFTASSGPITGGVLDFSDNTNSAHVATIGA